ncbi:MAG: hypothetical protein U9Q82_07680 [Chloroflexota bacterium]|nr:hypothetical protein [Chloroflexota bacterium]
MDIGMLWFDNDKKAGLDDKIKRAANYYQKKYGQFPDMCFVHPAMFSGNGNTRGVELCPQKGNPPSTERVEVRISQSLLPNHFWLGINQSETEPA